MGRYVLRRLLAMIVVVICAAIVVFTLMYLVPGDPARMSLGQDVSEEMLQAVRHEYGLDVPYYVQLFRFLYNTFIKFDFGQSWKYNVPVVDELLVRLPRTLCIGLPAIVLDVFIGTVMGISAATHEGKWQDTVMMIIAMVFVSAPNFWVALMLVQLFALNLGWLPPYGIESWACYILPVICSSLPAIATNARQARSSMLEVIRSDFVITAKAKGQKGSVITQKHMLPNAMMPIITGVAGGLTHIIAGSPVIETVFSIPGVGNYLLTCVNFRDRPGVCACVIFFSVFASIIVLLMDLCYAFLDPRIKAQYANSAKKKIKGAVNDG